MPFAVGRSEPRILGDLAAPTAAPLVPAVNGRVHRAVTPPSITSSPGRPRSVRTSPSDGARTPSERGIPLNFPSRRWYRAPRWAVVGRLPLAERSACGLPPPLTGRLLAPSPTGALQVPIESPRPPATKRAAPARPAPVNSRRSTIAGRPCGCIGEPVAKLIGTKVQNFPMTKEPSLPARRSSNYPGSSINTGPEDPEPLQG